MQEFLSTVLPLSLLVDRTPTGVPAIRPSFIHWGVSSVPAAEIRFANRDDSFYTSALTRPAGAKLSVTPLAAAAVKSVSLPGWEGELKFANGSGGLIETAPTEKPGNQAFALKIMQ